MTCNLVCLMCLHPDCAAKWRYIGKKASYLDMLRGLARHGCCDLLLVQGLQLGHVEQGSNNGETAACGESLLHPRVQVEGGSQLDACSSFPLIILHLSYCLHVLRHAPESVAVAN